MTIFALSTAAGKAGIAIIRISGPDCLTIVQKLGFSGTPEPRLATLHHFTAPPLSESIDRGVFIYFPAPHSFTGEDVLELHVHGGRAVISKMLNVLGHMKGLRLAEPGEFSKTAFRNGKMDLTAAEGIADLIDADTEAQRKQALLQASGYMHDTYMRWRETLLTALAHLEAYIDFPEEDIPDAIYAELSATIAELLQDMQTSLASHTIGEAIRDGIHIAIVGPPNAGKSSLLNAISKREAAIVSHQEGTTRDIIEVRMDLAGFAVILSDTAGMRESEDSIEQEGIRRAKQRADEADIIIAVIEYDKRKQAAEFYKQWPKDRCFRVLNKIDSANNHDSETGTDYYGVSAKNGRGLDRLLSDIASRITSHYAPTQSPLITRARHRQELEHAIESLEQFSHAGSLELECEELRHAMKSIGAITGHVGVDDVLDIIFHSFCIGK